MKLLIALLLLLLNSNLKPHGFGQNTSIILADYTHQSIHNLCQSSLTKNYPLPVLTYSEKIQNYSCQEIKTVGSSKTNCYFNISFNPCHTTDITCTPNQEFYLPTLNKWVPAYQLATGDELLSNNDTLTPITYIELVRSPLDVFIVEVKETHNFFVSGHAVLTHNIILPLHLFASAGIPFGSVAGGSIGSFFGPITIAGGMVLGGLVGMIVKIVRDDKIPSYKLPTYNIRQIDDYRTYHIQHKDKNDNTKAPGMPTKDDGFKPPKNWDGKKVRHPRNGNVGWPDRDGNIWVPSGPKGHGGPHWDVQHPGIGYTNILPGGRIRGKNK